MEREREREMGGQGGVFETGGRVLGFMGDRQQFCNFERSRG